MAPRDMVVSGADLQARLARLDGWVTDGRAIWRDYAIGYDEAVLAVTDIGTAAIELEHRPDIDIRWSRLRVSMTTHTAGDVVTELDFLLAARVDEIVAAHQAAADR